MKLEKNVGGQQDKPSGAGIGHLGQIRGAWDVYRCFNSSTGMHMPLTTELSLQW